MRYVHKIIKNELFLLCVGIVLVFCSAVIGPELIKWKILDRASSLYSLTSALIACVLFVGLPVLYIRHVLHKKISDFGMQLPKKMSEAVVLTSLVLIIFIPHMFLFAREPSFQSYYASSKNMPVFIFLTLVSGLYYFSEEFMFRGFLHFALWDKFKFHTIWIINSVFVIFHFAKPLPEVFFALVLGILLSLLSYRTRSFLPAFVIHFTLALILNILVTFVYAPVVVIYPHF